MRLDLSAVARCSAIALLSGILVGGAMAQAPKSDPTSALRAELEGKSPAERVEFLNQRIDAGQADRESYFFLGNAKYESGDLPGATAAFEKSVAMDSTFYKAVVNLGLMYEEQQNYAKAIEAFDHAARLEPKNPDSWTHLGNSYYSQNNYSKANELYRQALALDANSPSALYSMAVSFADAGIFREAVKYWQRVAEVDPKGDLGKNARENIDLVSKYLIP